LEHLLFTASTLDELDLSFCQACGEQICMALRRQSRFEDCPSASEAPQKLIGDAATCMSSSSHACRLWCHRLPRQMVAKIHFIRFLASSLETR
jgi:hypothetical protein